MRIKTLTLKNFKGIQNLSLCFNGNNSAIYGDNATGKTTLFDSFTWLLFEKDSLNRKDFNIKTIDATGEAMHGLEHEAECEFVDGLTLRKVYYEKWTKQKGSSEKVFSGHTTDYFVNGVPVKKNEYQDKINAIVKEDIFKLLSNPLYFNTQLHWQDRRKILFEVCGSVSAVDVMMANSQLNELSEILSKRTIEEHKKVITGKLKEINQELEKIPVRIAENQKSIENDENLNKDDLQSAIENLELLISTKQIELTQLENGDQVLVHKQKISELESQIREIKTAYEKDKVEAYSAHQKRLTNGSQAVSRVELEVVDLTHKVNTWDRSIKLLEAEITRFRKKFVEENQKEISLEDSCPFCKQSLPNEQLAEATNKFNLQKAKVLEEINLNGKKAKAELDELTVELTTATEQLEKARKILADYKELYSQIGEFEFRKLEEDASYQELITKLESLKEDKPFETSPEVETIKNQIQEYRADQNDIRLQLAKLEANEKTLARIAELVVQERTLADEHREISRQAYLIDEYIKTECKMVEDKINSKFKLAKWKLFDNQINGGISETCECVVNGVPYSDLNNAMRINSGIDIINTLSQHYSINVPVFVDNSESVTNIENTDGQMVNLVVDGRFKALKLNPTAKELAGTDVEFVKKLDKYVNKLQALESAGVDNWEGYDYAMEILNKIEEEK